MGKAATELEKLRQAKARLRQIQHYEEVTHNVSKTCRRHGVPRVSMKRYWPGPRRRREFTVPGQSVQVDVKHLKLGSRRSYQFPAVDEATRYRVLRIYTHSSIPNAIALLDELRQRFPMAIQWVQIQWVQTDHGNEFGTDFTWHLRDLGIAHRRIPPGYPEVKRQGGTQSSDGREGILPPYDLPYGRGAYGQAALWALSGQLGKLSEDYRS